MAEATLKLRTLLGDYPGTVALKRGEVRSPTVAFELADVKMPHTAFKRVVRDLEFDVAEIALVTFIMARAYGKPLVLLPAVLFSRSQHPYLVYNAERGRLTPKDLEGRRVGNDRPLEWRRASDGVRSLYSAARHEIRGINGAIPRI